MWGTPLYSPLGGVVRLINSMKFLRNTSTHILENPPPLLPTDLKQGGLFQDRPGGPKILGDFASWNIDFLNVNENHVLEV